MHTYKIYIRKLYVHAYVYINIRIFDSYMRMCANKKMTHTHTHTHTHIHTHTFIKYETTSIAIESISKIYTVREILKFWKSSVNIKQKNVVRGDR